uniref:Uncharacterized protein n=1 Tax=Oryza nivara TaxID=4536 RepID=A0A0E0HWQ6_ORYNI
MRGRSGSLTTDSGGADCRRGRCPPNRLRRRTRLPFRCWYLTSHHIYPATTASAEKKRDDVLKPADGVDEGEVAPGADGTRRDAVLRSIACNLRESEAKEDGEATAASRNSVAPIAHAVLQAAVIKLHLCSSTGEIYLVCDPTSTMRGKYCAVHVNAFVPKICIGA